MQSNELSRTMVLSSGVRAGGALGDSAATKIASYDSWMSAALQKPTQFAIKRAIDILVSATALLILFPLFLLIAVAIQLENRGPVLFSQLRWGKAGSKIKVYKFRSMRSDMCDYSGVAQTRANDPRVTRVGAFLRKSNLDELPQLINILKGDMSLVGPRCHVPGMLAAGVLYEELVPDYHLRHLVRPGLTGLAQMKGYRGPTDQEDAARGRFSYDIAYIRTFSVWMDIKIMFTTVVNEIRSGKGF
jgi:lipopolysaccharide/colanic/teichoic acid biosynthesis glycosyltransferase